MTDVWTTVGEAHFVSLTTFRRSGAPVATPVWVAPDADGSLLVTTPSGSGKVKRLRRDPRVEMRPCSRRGAVEPGAPVATGRAELVEDDAGVSHAHDVLRAEYGFQFRLVMGIERVMRRGHTDRVVLRITPTDDGESATPLG